MIKDTLVLHKSPLWPWCWQGVCVWICLNAGVCIYVCVFACMCVCVCGLRSVYLCRLWLVFDAPGSVESSRLRAIVQSVRERPRRTFASHLFLAIQRRLQSARIPIACVRAWAQ